MQMKQTQAKWHVLQTAAEKKNTSQRTWVKKGEQKKCAELINIDMKM